MDTTPTPALSGLYLRSLLVVLLTDAGRPLTTAELVAGVDRAGFAVRGRPSKAISDALRWEVGRGRARRLGRGRYSAGYVARTTRSRMRARIAVARRASAPLSGQSFPSAS